MTTTINASNINGLIQTADTSGQLQLQTNGVAALTIDSSQNSSFAGNTTAVAFTSTSTNVSFTGASANFTGTVSATSYSGSGANLTGITTGGMTLLGTITPTAVNSISLSSLTLTGYKQIQIVFKNIALGGSGGTAYASYVSGDNTQSTGIWLVNASTAVTAGNGIATLDLNAGSLVCNVGNTGAVYSTSNRGGIDSHNITTSTTTIYLRNGSTNTWTAQGTIYIYGVK